jgi:hypothetical protein
MAKKKLSRDQKRKRKLNMRARPGASGSSRLGVVEEGFMRDAERVINDTFLAYGRAMKDADVLDALNQLIVDVQQGKISMLDASGERADAKGALIWNMKQHWQSVRTFDSTPSLLAARALQSLAGHVESIRAPGESHSYLRYLQGVEQGAGSSPDAPSDRVDVYSQGAIELPQNVTDSAEIGDEPVGGDWSPDERRLLDLGITWLRGSSESTWQPFRDEAARMSESGQAQAVANVCQYIYGLTQAGPVEAALRPVLDAAHARLSGAEPEHDAQGPNAANVEARHEP